MRRFLLSCWDIYGVDFYETNPSPIYEQSKNFTLCKRAYETYASTSTPHGSYWLKQHATGRLLRWAFHPLGCFMRQTDCQCRKRAVSVLEETVKHISYSRWSGYFSHWNPLHLERARLSHVQHGSLLRSFYKGVFSMISVIVANTAWWAFTVRRESCSAHFLCMNIHSQFNSILRLLSVGG